MKQECFGKWGYGTGYYHAIRETQILMAARMGVSGLKIKGFCGGICPRRMECREVTYIDEGRMNLWSANYVAGIKDFAGRADPERVADVLAWSRSIG